MSHPYARTKVGTVGAASVVVDLSGKAKKVVITSTADCWVNFNSPAVASSCLYIPAETPVNIDILFPQSLNVIQDSAGGTISVLELADTRLITTVHEFFTSDASLLLISSNTLTGDANLMKAVSSTATGDSSLLIEISATYTGDASLLSVLSNTVTGDTSLLAVVSDTATADSNLVDTVSGIVTADSNLLGTVSAAMTSDCVITVP